MPQVRCCFSWRGTSWLVARWVSGTGEMEEFVSRGRRAQANTIIRLYGALILSQSWLVWKTREVGDPFVRKIFVQGYFLCFRSISVLPCF